MYAYPSIATGLETSGAFAHHIKRDPVVHVLRTESNQGYPTVLKAAGPSTAAFAFYAAMQCGTVEADDLYRMSVKYGLATRNTSKMRTIVRRIA
jgi:hypothetical protein